MSPHKFIKSINGYPKINLFNESRIEMTDSLVASPSIRRNAQVGFAPFDPNPAKHMRTYARQCLLISSAALAIAWGPATAATSTSATTATSATTTSATTKTVEQAPANVAGTWAMTVISKMGTNKPTAVLVQNGSHLTGIYRGRMGDTPLTGTVTGNNLQIDIPIKMMGRELQLTYKAVVDGDTMAGTTKMAQMGEGAFTGKRTTANGKAP